MDRREHAHRVASRLPARHPTLKIDPKPQTGYVQTMISNVPSIASIMMMPLSIPEAGPFGM